MNSSFASYNLIRIFTYLTGYKLAKVVYLNTSMDIQTHFKGMQFFWKGLKAAKSDMWASLQVLVIATFVLGTILYFVEHDAQPDVYGHWYDPYVWGFMNYLGNPGKFSPGEPITMLGRFIAIIISVIKILIFAVPAGLVANGFRAAMIEDKQAKKDAKNASRIIESMHVHCSMLKGVRYWPKKHYRFSEIKINLGMSEDDIISAVASSPYLRLRDLSTWLTTTGGIKPEMMAVEMCYANRSYGYFEFNPQSNVTIVCPVAMSEAGLGYYAYHLAKIGGFNLVLNEQLSSNADAVENRCIMSGINSNQYNDRESFPRLHEFVDDIKSCVKSQDNMVIVLKAAASPKDEDNKKQKIRMTISVDEEHEGNSLNECNTVDDNNRLAEFYADMCKVMDEEHDIEPCVRYSKGKLSLTRNYIRNNFEQHPNVIELDIADDYRVFGSDVKAQWTSVYTLASIIHRHFDANNKDRENIENWTSVEAKLNRSTLIPKI